MSNALALRGWKRGVSSLQYVLSAVVSTFPFPPSVKVLRRSLARDTFCWSGAAAGACDGVQWKLLQLVEKAMFCILVSSYAAGCTIQQCKAYTASL